MSRIKHVSMILTAGLLTAGVAQTQVVESNGQAESHASAKAASVTSEASASARADAQQLRERIAQRAARTSHEARARAESRLDATAKQVEVTAQNAGEAKVAQRLAAEFGMSTQALLDERAALDASWGQLMIAHTIDANSSTDVTVEQLIAMQRDGMGWGSIAAGLGLQLGSVVSSVKAESRVANGLAKADGQVSRMQGEGARGVSANAGVQGGLGVGHAGAGAGLGVGVKVGR